MVFFILKYFLLPKRFNRNYNAVPFLGTKKFDISAFSRVSSFIFLSIPPAYPVRASVEPATTVTWHNDRNRIMTYCAADCLGRRFSQTFLFGYYIRDFSISHSVSVRNSFLKFPKPFFEMALF